MNPSWCHWMHLIIRNTNICGLGVGNRTVSKLYGAWGIKIFWWTGEYSADDNTVILGC